LFIVAAHLHNKCQKKCRKNLPTNATVFRNSLITHSLIYMLTSLFLDKFHDFRLG